jgi:hypothetical protein
MEQKIEVLAKEAEKLGFKLEKEFVAVYISPTCQVFWEVTLKALVPKQAGCL